MAFPAYAGMNRVTSAVITAPGRVPRVCGDEPKEFTPDIIFVERSPRMRG